MKLTKYSHACIVLEEAGRSLVIDPGNFSEDFEVPQSVTGVIITHSHADHCDEVKLQAILDQHPDASIYALQEIADAANVPIVAIKPGQKVTIGNFAIEFAGGSHAVIHTDMPRVGNVGVIVNHDLLYYPGDSFERPPRHMKWIATPVAAPWLKVSEAVDFLRQAHPDNAFPTHDAILSDAGKALVDRVVAGLIDKNVRYQRVQSGKTIEL